MNKRNEHLFTWIPLLTLTVFGFGAPLNLMPAERFPKGTVDNFFRTWLVQKDEKATLKFFHRNAFENKYILGNCPGEYLRKEERNNSAKIENAVRRALKDVNTLKDASLVLPSDDPLDVFGDFVIRMKKFSISVLGRDKYLIVKYSSLFKTISPPARRFFRKHFDLRGAFFSIAAIGRSEENESEYGLLYFLWVRDGNKWKIAHFAFICQ